MKIVGKMIIIFKLEVNDWCWFNNKKCFNFVLNLEEDTFLTFPGIFCHRSVATEDMDCFPIFVRTRGLCRFF